MDTYITGSAIRALREKKGMTQSALAERLGVSDKTVSKWETGRGYPDITLLEPIAEVFSISVSELLAGETVNNMNVSANMMRSGFCVCPVCGNIIHSMGDAMITCHGIRLLPADEEPCDENHAIRVEVIENEYYVTVDHDMTKQHYISFIAAVSPAEVQIRKLYPEQNAEAYFRMRGVRKILICCNRDGVYKWISKKK